MDRKKSRFYTREKVNYELLKESSQEKGLAICELSQKIGKSKSYVSKIAGKDALMDSGEVRSIERLLGLPKYSLRKDGSQPIPHERVNFDRLSDLMTERGLTTMNVSECLEKGRGYIGFIRRYADGMPSDEVRKLEKLLGIKEGDLYTCGKHQEDGGKDMEKDMELLNIDLLLEKLNEKKYSYEEFSAEMGREDDYVDRLVIGELIAGKNAIKLMERVLELPEGTLLKEHMEEGSDLHREIIALNDTVSELKKTVEKTMQYCSETRSAVSKLLKGQEKFQKEISDVLVKLVHEQDEMRKGIDSMGKTASTSVKQLMQMKNGSISDHKEIMDALSDLEKIERDCETNKRQLAYIKESAAECSRILKETEARYEQSTEKESGTATEVKRAKELLMSLFKEKNVVNKLDAEKQAMDEGISKEALQMAGKDLQIMESFSGHGKNRRDIWILQKSGRKS